MARRCRVCLVEKAKAELDSTGRCWGCALAKEATDRHTTYGRYRAALEARKEAAGLPPRAALPPTQIKTKKCRWCGAEFVVGNRNKAYCSDECRKAQNDAWNRERKALRARGETPVLEARSCVICGNVFLPHVVHQITCSPECSLKRQRETGRRYRMEKAALQEGAAPLAEFSK